MDDIITFMSTIPYVYLMPLTIVMSVVTVLAINKIFGVIFTDTLFAKLFNIFTPGKTECPRCQKDMYLSSDTNDGKVYTCLPCKHKFTVTVVNKEILTTMSKINK